FGCRRVERVDQRPGSVLDRVTCGDRGVRDVRGLEAATDQQLEFGAKAQLFPTVTVRVAHVARKLDLRANAAAERQRSAGGELRRRLAVRPRGVRTCVVTLRPGHFAEPGLRARARS